MSIRDLFNRSVDRSSGSVIEIEGLSEILSKGDLETLTRAEIKTLTDAAGGTRGGKDEGEGPVTGAFITAQSLTSFAGATGAISVIWSAFTILLPSARDYSTWIGFLISVLIGMTIYWLNVTDPKAPLTARQKQVGFIIACLNTLVLFTASFGISKAAAGG